MIEVWIILLSSLWALIITDNLIKIPKNMKSHYILVELFIKMLRCPLCVSYHLTWLSWLILIGNGWGFIFGAITFFLTYVIETKIINIEI